MPNQFARENSAPELRRDGIFVTGGAGFIGSHFTEACLRAGIPVVAIDNFDAFYSRSAKEANLRAVQATAAASGTRFTFSEASLSAIPEDLFDRAGFSPKTCLHLAAKAGVRPSLADPTGYCHTNLDGTVAVLEFCRRRGTSNFVFGSSSSVYGNQSKVPFSETDPALEPVSPYAATKRAGELLCSVHARLYGMKVACLRFFTVYGPRQRPDLAIRKFTERVMKGETIEVYGDGESYRDYTFVNDIVDGVLRAANWAAAAPASSFDVFNLGGAHPVKLKDLIAHIETAVGRAAVIERKPMQLGDVDRTYADISKSQRVLGYDSQTRIEDGLAAFVSWLREPGR